FERLARDLRRASVEPRRVPDHEAVGVEIDERGIAVRDRHYQLPRREGRFAAITNSASPRPATHDRDTGARKSPSPEFALNERLAAGGFGFAPYVLAPT